MTAVDVSVLIPSYQYGRFVGDAIESALRQDGVEVEIIVQDGASTDGTVDVLQRYDSVVDWRSEPDGGQSDALNRAVARARGRWIGWLNADDFYLEGALRRLVAAGDAAGADVVFGDVVLVDEDGAVVRLLPQHRLDPQVLRDYGPAIANCGALFRRAAIGERPWDQHLRLLMDWDLYLRLQAEGATFTHMALAAAGFRLHAAQATQRLTEDLLEGEERILAGRHGVRRGSTRSRVLGTLRHGLLKLAAGSYRRQVRVRGLRTKDIRWFSGEAQRVATLSLQACYTRGAGE